MGMLHTLPGRQSEDDPATLSGQNARATPTKLQHVDFSGGLDPRAEPRSLGQRDARADELRIPLATLITKRATGGPREEASYGEVAFEAHPCS